MSEPFCELPTNSAYPVALPAVQLNVTVDELKVDPGAGLSICAGPGVGVAEGVTVAVGVGVEELLAKS